MSYDIELIDRKTKEVVMLENPFYVRGGNVRAEIDPVTNKLVQAKEIEAHINITYNYSHYFYEATEGDERFAVKDSDTGEVSYGIRGIYGKTPFESVSMLNDMIKRISEKYQDENGQWYVTERTRQHYWDESGNEIKDPIRAILNHEPHTVTEETYLVSEGDTSDYWESTAANAIESLMNMFAIAVDCLLYDCEWSGD